MGFLPVTSYPPYRMGQTSQPQPPASSALAVSKTPTYSLNAATGGGTSESPGKDPRTGKPLPPGMTVVQTGGDGEEKAVPIMDLLVDPITRKKFDIDTPFTDRQLHLTPLQKVKAALEHGFVTLPKTIAQGLRGDNRFTFSDSLDVASIPYYMGGFVLSGSFIAGRDGFNGLRQGIGVGLYYLGVIGANQAINLFYKAKSGVDLNLKYRKPNGDVEKMLASVNFPRVDLLTKAQREKIIRKTGIPSNVADPDREVNDQIREIISAARADKLILGNMAAAIGAGYIARTANWGRLLHSNEALRRIWDMSAPDEGSIPKRIKNTGTFIWSKTEKALMSALKGEATETNPWLRRSLWGGLIGGAGLILWHSWTTINRQKRPYQSPFLSNLSPELAPELSPQTAAIQRNLPGGEVQRLNRQSIFETVRNVEARTQQEAAEPQQGASV